MNENNPGSLEDIVLYIVYVPKFVATNNKWENS